MATASPQEEARIRRVAGRLRPDLKPLLPQMSLDAIRENVPGAFYREERGQDTAQPQPPAPAPPSVARPARPGRGLGQIALRPSLINPEPDFKSQTERRAWAYVDTLDPPPLEKWYEPLMFRAAGGNYTPDFMLFMPGGELWFIEVKGAGKFRAHKSGRSSKKALKEAAHNFAFMGRWFSLVAIPKKDGGGWLLDEYSPSPEE